ncbi:MAG: hypothetical protein CMP21_00885 [Rickettsiales bacterium]|mgnify:CR=1 FL=1|nr:hypothetical protein [Rickettsiales bacterium]|tara:strand:- start:4692 stop:6176 length:1485 start_codon:yes stop_codon:yes gene_type:complete
MKNYLNTFISQHHIPIGLGDASQTINKSQLNDYITSFSNTLIQKNKFDKQQPSIAILLDRENTYFVSMFATWSIGGYFIPLNTTWPEHRILEILSHANPDLVICHKNSWYKNDNAIYIEDIIIENKPIDNKEIFSTKQTDLAYIIYTSGSTGEPKGVCITYEAYSAYIEWTKRYFNSYKQNKALLITAELTFDITMGDIAFALAFGTAIFVSPDPKNIFTHLKMIQAHKIDTFYSVPTTHQLLFSFVKQKRNLDISSISLILSGGESFSPALPKLIKTLLPEAHFYNVYGPTEVTINCVACRLDNQLDSLNQYGVPIGKPFDHLNAIIIDKDNQIITTDSSTGQLCINGIQTMKGYLNDEHLTKNSFITINNKLYYKTGDLVQKNKKNHLLYIFGRIDDLVKIKGYRINPNEITTILLENEQISAATTILIEEETPYFISFIKGPNSLENQLFKNISKKLPTYMHPKQLIFLSEFPLNNSGKIDKSALLKIVKQ